ncbi:glycosyltransferase [Mycobacterium angelicum]|uniref:Glycosyl transferase family 1 n=1 Tax=Mycobacterium angelicum TaxID=470074 RepID=A0A1W9ZCG7_MYCAN|nr:glycosyltransferase [Mycobacterium angelicum]MCV7198678.1 glycosyltransferase [Mycobacterium angelicum]ORA12094.1 glycosyl transferase family 1 [Mycobacterium angelicum]
MKIAIVSGDDVSARDRADIDNDGCGQLCGALAGHGHDVTAYLRRSNRRTADVATETGYRMVAVCAGPAEALSPPQVLPYVGDWAAELASLWSSDPPDIVHAFGWLGGMAAQLAARQQDLPTVQTFHGLAATTPTMHDSPGVRPCPEQLRLEPLLARNATWATGGSSDELDALARLRRGRGRLSILSTGVDVERYTPVGPALARTDMHRIVCAAPNPLPCNGFDQIIRVLPRLSGAELVVAETTVPETAQDTDWSEQRGELKELAAQLGVSDRVWFMGTVTADELSSVLRSADVVACTPWQSPRATTALQAMASGVAVVAVSVGALADTVVHPVTGLLVPAAHPADLAGALKTLQEQRFRCEGMGATGRLRAESRFGWGRIALDTLHIYDRVNSLRQSRVVANAG